MPPRKRALEEADANAQPAAKRSSTGKAVEKAAEKPAEQEPGRTSGQTPEKPAEEENSSKGTENAKESEDASKKNNGLALRKFNEYICINRPLFDFASEKNDDDEDDDEETTFEAYREAAEGPNKMWSKPAAEHPNWKWVMMVQAWKDYCELRKKATYVNPDLFGMHVYTDFEGYGLHDILENKLKDFDKEYKKTDRSLHQMWIIMTTIGHWLNEEDTLMTLIGVDDRERTNAFMGVLGCAFLSVLDAVDQAGELKVDSQLRDLGLVMSFWLEWSWDLEDYVVAYAKKAGIDLKATGCHGVAKAITKHKAVKPVKDGKAGRWNWPKKFKDFQAQYTYGFIPFDLPCFDITKWPRELRAQWNFDKVDPLADIPEKDLKEGNIMVG